MTAATVTPKGLDDTLFSRAFVLLALADLAYFTAAGVAIYTLPLYVTGPLGSNKAAAGIAFGVFAVSALVLRPFGGRLADTLGRRPMLFGGALIASLGLALTATADSLAAIIALRLLLGVAEAAFFVASLAALADLAPPARMGEAISYNSLGLYLGLAFGPPLGEALVETWSYTTAWYGAAVLTTAAGFVAFGIGETRSQVSDGGSHRLIHRQAIPASLAFFASLLAIGGFLAFSSLHAEEVGLASSSVPLFLYGIIVVICRIAFAKVPDRLPPLRLGAAALATITAGLMLIATWTTPAGMLVGTALMAVGVTFSTPAFFSAIFATAKPSERGAASGTASLFIDLGLGGGPIILGLVAQSASISWALMAGAGLAAAGAVWSLHLHRAGTRVVSVTTA